jgi:hypothetical protein
MNLLQFIKTAEPHSAYVYQTGPTLHGAIGLSEVRSRYDDGMVDLVQRRADKGWDYIMVFRRHKANIPKGWRFADAELQVK